MQKPNALFLATLLVGFLGGPADLPFAYGADVPDTGGLEDTPATVGAEDPAAQTAYADGKPAKKARDNLRVKGRVIFRSQFEKLSNLPDPNTPDESMDLTLPSARLGMEYSVLDWLSLVVEVELAERPHLRDGFLLSKWRHFGITAGQFKMPESAIEYASPWRLPLARRGLLHDLLQDQLQVGGRRPGAVFEVRKLGSLDLRVQAGAFQGSFWDRDEFNLAENQSLNNQNLVLRTSISPGPLEVAAYFESRTFEIIGDFTRFWTVGADVTWDQEFETTGMRAWVEGITGSSWADENLYDRNFTTFLMGRAIVAWRYGGISTGGGYIEPYGMLGVLDPNREMPSDTISEVVVGLNAGFWKKARITLELGMTRVGDVIPLYLVSDTAIRPVAYDGKSVVLQVGAAL